MHWWGKDNHSHVFINTDYFMSGLKSIWNLLMVVYFILHHLQGYSGTDLEFCGLVILTCTLQALSFPFWLFRLQIFDDADFICHQENRYVLASALYFGLFCILHSFYFKSFLQCLAAFCRVIRRRVVFSCDMWHVAISILNWIHILYLQMWTKKYQGSWNCTILYSLQDARLIFFNSEMVD